MAQVEPQPDPAETLDDGDEAGELGATAPEHDPELRLDAAHLADRHGSNLPLRLQVQTSTQLGDERWDLVLVALPDDGEVPAPGRRPEPQGARGDGVGPRVGDLAHIAYFGGRRGGGGSVRDPEYWLESEAPTLEKYIGKILEDLL